MKIFNQKHLIHYSTLFIILIWWIIFGYNLSLEPYVWDDLHFFRNYSIDELKNSWIGNWDSDGIETLSYRPLAVLYYHSVYIIFEENTFLLRNFIIFQAFILILITNVFLAYFDFSKNQIIIFTLLIVFSKIFITLIAWFTISVLLVAYILAISSILFFFMSIEKKSYFYFFISFFLASCSIFIREELYVLPAILFLLFFLKYDVNLKNILHCFSKISLFFLIVFLHMFLRKKFIPDADHLAFIDNKIMFGDNIIGFGGLIKAFKSSFLPMGYYSSQYSDEIQKYLSLIWLTLILISIMILFKEMLGKESYKVTLKKIFIFLSLSVVSCLPHLTIDRSFGIFLPSIFALILISALINSLFLSKKYFENKLRFTKIGLAVFLLLIGTLGGIYRSNLHSESMSHFSKNIIEFDSLFIYGYENQGVKVSIPIDRYKKKREHLENLNIFDFDWGLKIENSSPKIIKNRYHPLSF